MVSERNGRWSKANDLRGPAARGQVSSLSCASAGNCGAGGYHFNGYDNYGNLLSGAFVAGERNGRWAAPEVPPGLAALNLGGNAQVNSVSCAAASRCSAGGSYTDGSGHGQAFVDGSQ